MKHPWKFLIVAVLAYSLCSGGCETRDCTGPGWVKGSPELAGVYWGIGQARLDKDIEQAKKKAYESAVDALAHMVGRVVTSNVVHSGTIRPGGDTSIVRSQAAQAVKAAITEQRLKGFRLRDFWWDECQEVYHVLVVIDKYQARMIISETSWDLKHHRSTKERPGEPVHPSHPGKEVRVKKLIPSMPVSRYESKPIMQEPRNALGHFIRGNGYLAQGDYDRAVNEYTKAIELNPRSAVAYHTRGAVYAKKGDYSRAIRDYGKALELDPKSALTYHKRGVAYSKKGRENRAIRDYNKAIELDPTYALAYHDRAIAYSITGDEFRSERDLKKARKLGYGSTCLPVQDQ